MQVPNYLSKAIAMTVLMAPGFLKAQTISAEEKTAAIQKISRHIATQYVYPEKGGQIASHLQLANHRGEFDNVSSWHAFDEQVTTSIRKFSNDQHLYVKYDPKLASQLASGNLENASRMYLHEHDNSSSSAGIAEAKVMEDNVGYLKLDAININESTLPELSSAMNKLKDTRSMIIDLRDNAGGGSELGPILESYFLPAGTPLLEFVSRDGRVRKMNALNGVDGRYEKPVFIIINKNTASAAEAFAYVLQQNKRARIVGENSAGAAYMNQWFAVDDNSYISVSTSVPHIPGTDLNWQDRGVLPDIKVKKGDPVREILGLEARS